MSQILQTLCRTSGQEKWKNKKQQKKNIKIEKERSCPTHTYIYIYFFNNLTIVLWRFPSVKYLKNKKSVFGFFISFLKLLPKTTHALVCLSKKWRFWVWQQLKSFFLMQIFLFRFTNIPSFTKKANTDWKKIMDTLYFVSCSFF